MKSFRNLIFLVIVFGVASCSPKFYTPNTQNVPLITEKGETNLTLSGNANQVEFQGAYGITKNIAVKANGGLFIPSDLDNGDGGSGKFIELGGGYFKPITENWIFEAYGIFGFGSFENHLVSTTNDHPLTNGDITANILRIGVQPNFGFKSKYFSAAVSSRIVNLSYSKIKGDLIFDDINQQNYLKDNSSNFLIEPALTIRGGFEKIKLQVQYGYSLNLSNRDFKQDNTFLTVGLNFNFN
ncbi:MAG: hypothetical protein PHE33_02050 [Bacteroidales bacterium]|nr:hypothetical protein [Bacteroidales bacterium]